ncbi:MAG: family 43 glycosylhydrolase [Chthoniobacterales bacterium]|nr:family 43 glycosylhydrolase [Chthoniobacterales bacterium]
MRKIAATAPHPLLFAGSLLAAWVLSSFLAASACADSFVLATFNNGEQKLRILHSTNAAEFLGHAQGTVYTPPPGNNLRDPSITHHRGRYYLCHTAGNFGAVDFFSILVSDNLWDWSHLTDVSMAAVGDVLWTWAPEWFLDDDGSLHVFVSASTTPQISIKHKIYELHPLDPDVLTEWSVPAEVTGPEAFPPWTEDETYVGAYDPYVVKRDGTYWMFFYNTRSWHIELARSTNGLTGPYEPSRTNNWQGIGAFKEGPTVMYLGGGRWRMIYADVIYSFLSYIDSTNNWATWSAPQPVTLPGAPTNFTVNHGTLIVPPGGLDLDARIATAGAGHVQIAFQATEGDHYRLSTSTNLSAWTTAEIIPPAASNPVIRTLPTSGSERQFWRLERLLP